MGHHSLMNSLHCSWEGLGFAKSSVLAVEPTADADCSAEAAFTREELQDLPAQHHPPALYKPCLGPMNWVTPCAPSCCSSYQLPSFLFFRTKTSLTKFGFKTVPDRMNSPGMQQSYAEGLCSSKHRKKPNPNYLKRWCTTRGTSPGASCKLTTTALLLQSNQENSPCRWNVGWWKWRFQVKFWPGHKWKETILTFYCSKHPSLL